MGKQNLTVHLKNWFVKHKQVGLFLLRIFFAFILIYGVQDNVFSYQRMLEFRDFLKQNGFPWPLASAYLSVYAQFICGIFILVGLLPRTASAIMVINFIIALVMVHIGLSFSVNIAPMSMLALAVFFVFYGAPHYSLEARYNLFHAQRARTNLS